MTGLQQSLAPYGKLLDYGIMLEPRTQYFMGTGYAFITTDDSNAAPLTHKIPWCNASESFHATGAAIPDWCGYCHEEDHPKFDCAKSTASIVYYLCQGRCHRSFECPRKNTKEKENSSNLRSFFSLVRIQSYCLSTFHQQQQLRQHDIPTDTPIIQYPPTISPTTDNRGLGSEWEEDEIDESYPDTYKSDCEHVQPSQDDHHDYSTQVTASDQMEYESETTTTHMILQSNNTDQQTAIFIGTPT